MKHVISYFILFLIYFCVVSSYFTLIFIRITSIHSVSIEWYLFINLTIFKADNLCMGFLVCVHFCLKYTYIHIFFSNLYFWIMISLPDFYLNLLKFVNEWLKALKHMLTQPCHKCHYDQSANVNFVIISF